MSHSGTLERKWIALFGRMRERREKNQYDLAAPATPEEIRELLILAEKFVDELETVLKGIFFSIENSHEGDLFSCCTPFYPVAYLWSRIFRSTMIRESGMTTQERYSGREHNIPRVIRLR